MRIKRDIYLNKLIQRWGIGLVKIVTGVRRCSKPYLLFNMFHEYLASNGTDEEHIIETALDDRTNKELRDPDGILKFIKDKINGSNYFYIVHDEVQMLDEFEDILNSLLHIGNADVCVTGSNSRFPSYDLVTDYEAGATKCAYTRSASSFSDQ